VDPKAAASQSSKVYARSPIMGAAPLMSAMRFRRVTRVPPQSPKAPCRENMGEQVFRCRHSDLAATPGFREYRSDWQNEIVAKALDHGIDSSTMPGSTTTAYERG